MFEETDFEKLKGDKHIPLKNLLKRILSYLKNEWVYIIVAVILMLLSISVEIVTPLLLQYFEKQIQLPSTALSLVIWIAVGFLLITIAAQICAYFEAMILQKTGQRIIYKVRMEVFEHIEKMSQNQFNEMPVGSLVTRVANYTAAMSGLFTDVLVSLMKNICLIIGTFVAMFILSWQLSLVMFAFVVVIFFISIFFRKVIRNAYSKERKHISDLNTFLNENLSGMKIIQIFNQQKRKEEEFNEKNENLRKARFKIVIFYGIYRPLISFLYFLAIAVTFLLGMVFNLPSVLAFYLYLSRFFNPIQNIADQLTNIQKATTASEKLFNLLDVKPEVVDKKNALEIEHFEGEIEFKHVWFAYIKDEWILKDVSFTIEPKQTAAFVGATGAGKTTILQLIVRNYEVQKGEILIDGINVNDIKIQSLRKAVGQMLQDVFLFSGNIRDNISLHDENFTDEEIMDACKYVNADQFIAKSEHGLDEEVIERGENFSQGQRQLLSFARTVIHKPQILILDEATANIDAETETLIQESLSRIKNIGTMLVVAHRLSTIQSADQIIVLNYGEVVEKGTHQELLRNKGYYYKLYKLQYENTESFGEFVPDFTQLKNPAN